MQDAVYLILNAVEELDDFERELYFTALGCWSCRAYEHCDYGQQVAARPEQLAAIVPDSIPPVQKAPAKSR